MRIRIALLLCILLVTAGCKPITAEPAPVQEAAPPASAPSALTLEPTGFVQRIHDPVMAKDGDTYYVFSTGSRIIVICSKDMINWEWCGRVFEDTPKWLKEAVPGGGYSQAPAMSLLIWMVTSATPGASFARIVLLEWQVAPLLLRFHLWQESLVDWPGNQSHARQRQSRLQMGGRRRSDPFDQW